MDSSGIQMDLQPKSVWSDGQRSKISLVLNSQADYIIAYRTEKFSSRITGFKLLQASANCIETFVEYAKNLTLVEVSYDFYICFLCIFVLCYHYFGE